MRLNRIITSLLDTDLYKFSMGQAIYHQFSDYKTTWSFKCRNEDVHFTKEMVEEITEQIKGKKYVTYIYADEGMLKELFISAEKEPKLQDGTALLEMQNLTFEEEGDGYLNIGLQTEQEKMHRFLIRKRSNSL